MQLMCYPVIQVIYIPSCVVCDCCYWCLFLFVCVLVFSLIVYFQALLVAIRLDSPQRIVVGFVFTGVAAGCLVLFL